jgi:GNAT superfamily N-acetyltransferase
MAAVAPAPGGALMRLHRWRAGRANGFATARGATVLMRLIVQEQRLGGLPPAPAPVPGVGLVFWTGAAPDHLIESYAAAYAGLTDAPGSRHQLPGAPPGPDELRRRDARRDLWVCAAVAGETVVAFTEIEAEPGPAASQHATVVLPGHRRRGLGAAVKWALADRLRAARPGIATVTTTVNADNTAMLALNERLGYRPVRTRLLVRLAPAAS